jgi:hypothetical protein
VVRAALIALDAFTSLTAIGGGFPLATGVEGARFPPELLIGTPLSDYVVPGLLLASIVGGSAAVATVTTVRSQWRGALASAVAGAVLMAWIVGEVLILRSPEARSWLEAGYFSIGLLMALLGCRAGRGPQCRVPSAGYCSRRRFAGRSIHLGNAAQPTA